MAVPPRFGDAGLSIHHGFEPGDLGMLIHIHGVQNRKDYGFDAQHEAYCARIACDFMLNPTPGRSRAWLVKKDGVVAGSVFVSDLADGRAQLRLLFVDDALRGLGLGRWLVEEAVRYGREAGFTSMFLWTVDGLDRALSIYRDCGFTLAQTKDNQDWGRRSRELRFDLRY